MRYVLAWVAWSVGIFLAVVVWRRIFPGPMPRLFDPTLDTAYRRRHFSPEVAADRHGLVPGMLVLEIGPAGGYLTGAAVERVGPRGRVRARAVLRRGLPVHAALPRVGGMTRW